MRKYAISLLFLMTWAITSCTPASTSVSGSSLATNVPVWSSLGSIVKFNNGSILDVTADPASVNKTTGESNSVPTWIMYDIVGRTVTDVTPLGIATRGGIALSYLSSGTIWVDIGSYKGQHDGIFGISDNYGKSWQVGVLPGISQPTPFSIAAVTKNEAYFLLGIGRQRSIWVTTDDGNSFKEILNSVALDALLPKGCQINSITYDLQTLFMGTTCRSTSRFIVIKYRPITKYSALTESNFPIGIKKFYGISFVEINRGSPVEFGISYKPDLLINLSGLETGEKFSAVSYSLAGYTGVSESFPIASMSDNLLSLYMTSSKATMQTVMTFTISANDTISSVTSLSVSDSHSDAILQTQGHVYLNYNSSNSMKLYSYSKPNADWTEVDLPPPPAPSIIANS